MRGSCRFLRLIDDMRKALEDREYQKELLKEFDIS